METVEYQRSVLETLDKILAAQIKGNALLQQILDTDQKILADETTDNDITTLGGSISAPVPQGKKMTDKPKHWEDEGKMPIAKLAANLTQAMFDDQTATITLQPVNAAGAAEAFPTGSAPVYTVSPGTVVAIVPATDGSGSCVVNGVPGQSGTEVVTANYTNPDGTAAAPSTFTFTQSVDPTESDVATLGGAISTPVAQTASAKKKP
jgi:hypothetical protein